ncbi:MAG: malto-oligosyltrehalose trehalohydrolase [Variibacter sp.]
MTWTPQFGPRIERDGVTFRLFAPAARRVDLVTDKAVPMQVAGDGWHFVKLLGARVGTRYRFRIDDDIDVPDPASQFQPEDAFGPSEVIDHAFAWRCGDWKGRPWHETVLSELHVGAFSQAGTFRGAVAHLDALVEAGITAIELMPVADFAGRWNWGYDGVLLFAPDSAYGRPEDLKALVDAAHARGLMVFLDVVYNHFGPEGNFLSRYAPTFFTSDCRTPWGDAIDYRQEVVRAFAVENALHWLDRYRFDGLRLDAVHAIIEPGQRTLLEMLSRAVGDLARARGRHIHLVLEDDDNFATLLDPCEDIPNGRYRAQWNDDYHHAWHVLLTGERAGYYRDYDGPGPRLSRALSEGFVYQGEASAHRGGAPRGEASGMLPPTAFVDFLQNHDQIGNRPFGDRLVTLASPQAIDAALSMLLLAPSPPMLFMGEEWGAREPFPFFCDFKGDLAEAVRNGRKAEFAEAFAATSRDIPDPLSQATFRSAVLDWAQRAQEPFASRLALVKALLAVRRRRVVPLLASLGSGKASAQARFDDGLLSAAWALPGGTLRLRANLSDAAASAPPPIMPGDAIWGGAMPVRLPPWSVHWSVEGA